MALYARNPIGTIGYLGGLMAIPEPFVWSFTQMVQYNTEYLCEPGECVHYIHSTVSYHSFARNNLVDQMKGEWLLMMDSDHRFDPDIAVRMLFQMNKHNIDVLVAPYVFKADPHMPVLYTSNKDGSISLLGKWEGDADLFEVGSAGAGCLLIRRSVFKRIKDELKENPFDIIAPFSEDHSFFKRLQKLDIKAYFCPAIETNHLILKALSLKDYDSSGLVLSDMKQVEGFA